jgi:GNAT superfamily N-acetyltransferase
MTNTPELPDGFSIGPMRAAEVPLLDEMAAAEGWNPGLADIGIAWDIDPEAFIALRRGDELVGGGTIFSYSGGFGFMGLFIVLPEFRGAGLGTVLWHHRLDRLRQRLNPGAAIGMDGVLAMVPFYERGGFKLAWRDLRFEGPAQGAHGPAVLTLAQIDFNELDRYDQRHVPTPRTRFLERWVNQPGAGVAALREGGALVGYGVVRPCRVGHKIGPVFADRPDLAETLVRSLMATVEGQRVQLDVPQANAAAVDMAQRLGLVEAFGCARLFCGAQPQLPVDAIFGVTSFEFG